MAQRVAIALALAGDPALLVADEPTTALDVTVQRQVLDLLGELKDGGTSVLLISHDLAVVARLADRIAVMHGGLIVEQGPADQLLADPRHPYTQALLAAVPALHAKGTRLSVRTPPGAAAGPGGCPYATRCPRADEFCRTELPPPERVDEPGGPGQGPLGPGHWVVCRHPDPRPAAVAGTGPVRVTERQPAPERTRLPGQVASGLASSSPVSSGPVSSGLVLSGVVSSGPEPGLSESAGPRVLIEVEGIAKRFRSPGGGWRDAVLNVSFELRAGEALGVVGESGSGKTTAARIVLGTVEPDEGTVRFEGEPWSGVKERERRARRSRIQAVYQDPLGSFDPRFTVDRIVGEALGAAGVRRGSGRRDRTVELLDQVGLAAGMLPRRPLELSGGQRQRVAIARALASSPDVIVCDEPVSALDVSIQAQILDLLADLQRDLGVALLFISHDLGVIHHVSDRVIVMKDGRIVETGAVAEVFARPADPYTRELLAAIPRPVAPATSHDPDAG